MIQLIHHFWRDDGAATAIEYGLIAALIALAIIVAVQAMGLQLVSVFQAVTSGFQSAG